MNKKIIDREIFFSIYYPEEQERDEEWFKKETKENNVVSKRMNRFKYKSIKRHVVQG